ncbi:MAG: cysteine desulfurase [Lachnospiraceae bacterium]|nr:cysteine desulfurase [Lachnospiraceae bacterium]
MIAYLDNAATTKVSQSVYDKMTSVFLKDFGNPSSMHKLGMDAENYIKEAKDIISKILKCEPGEITFTSGGTESNNTALIGSALANSRKGKHIITTQMEHASVYNPLLFLESLGYEISFAPVDEAGHVIIDALTDMVRDDTILVSVMLVNNEIGSINDVAAVSKAIKTKNPSVLFHVDAIQGFGKMKVIPKNMGIDMLSVSGHKILGPKGSGFLFVKKGVKIKPIIYGGGQEKGMRSGTENVPAISGLGQAAFDAYENLDKNREHLYALKERMIRGLLTLDNVHVHTFGDSKEEIADLHEKILQTAPHVVSCGFEGLSRSEVLLHALEEKQVYVSSGSACSSNHPAISGTLKAIGTDNKYLNSTLRFSFAPTTKEEEIDHALECLKELLPVLRKYTRH